MPELKPLTTPERYKYLEKFKMAKAIIVHVGSFHADDVFTVAYLQMYRKHLGMKPLNVFRNVTLKETHNINHGFIVADIGGGEFDHHHREEDKKKRANGIPYAAFGLVVRAFHEGFLSEIEYRRLDEKFIQGIDLHDNTGCGNTLSHVISCMNYSWDENPPDKLTNNGLDRFQKAVDFATMVLEAEIRSCKAIIKARDIAAKQYLTGYTVFMDTYAPVGEFYINNPDIKFVGSPNDRGGYQVVSCRNANGDMKALFPKSLRGMDRGIKNPDKNGMVFCHPSGFIASFIDKEHAKRFMNVMYMEMRENKNEQN